MPETTETISPAIAAIIHAAAAVRTAYDAAAGVWTGREWDDPEAITPGMSDDRILRALARDPEVMPTSWGIPRDGSHTSQRWLERASSVRERLSGAIADGGAVAGENDPVIRECCEQLRELARESDAAVASEAGRAEEAALEAMMSVEEAEIEAALEAAGRAAGIERQYGNAPTWGPFLEAVRSWYAAIQAAAAAGEGEGEDEDEEEGDEG